MNMEITRLDAKNVKGVEYAITTDFVHNAKIVEGGVFVNTTKLEVLAKIVVEAPYVSTESFEEDVSNVRLVLMESTKVDALIAEGQVFVFFVGSR